MILVTGYGNVTMEEPARIAGINRVLSKPITYAELGVVLYDLLHAEKVAPQCV